MKNKFINSRFLLGDEYSEVLSAEHFKSSGDLVIDKYPEVGLYLYRHFIELQLKSLMKRFNQKIDYTHNIEELLRILNNILTKNKILTNEEKTFMSEVILNYVDLDKKGTTLRYPNSKMGEHLILSDSFVEKNEIKNSDNPYLYTIKLEEVKLKIDKLFEILFKIHDSLEENEYLKKTYEKDYF